VDVAPAIGTLTVPSVGGTTVISLLDVLVMPLATLSSSFQA
jgi:hypothetical protein